MTCECGEKRDLRYGETWRCEGCGRRWDTNQIPPEQYEAIRRTQLRFRVLPLALMLWFYFVRPAHRRRYRKALADLPRWELRPL